MQAVTLAEQLKTKLEELTNQKLETQDFLLAVSGGKDSMALLYLMLKAGLKFSVAHLDHGIREDSSLDARFVQEVCAKLEISFFTERLNIPEIAAKRHWGLEEAARKIRYSFLTRIAQKINSTAILTAHHLEDNVETMLMQLLRGTARATGISAQHDRILRPLLEISKIELEHYLLEHNLNWQEDLSNTDTKYTRNWIRHELMPKLLERYPHALQSLSRYGMLARDEDELLDDLAQRIPIWTDLTKEPIALQRRYIRSQLEIEHIKADFEHIEAIRLKLGGKHVTRVSLPQNRVAVVQDNSLKILEHYDTAPVDFSEPEYFKTQKSIQNELKNLNIDLSNFPNTEIRTRKPGDTIQLPGGTKKLSELFIDLKIPREYRDGISLVAQDSQVLWIGLQPRIFDVRIGIARDIEIDAMKKGLELAREAFDAGEVPVGAVVLFENKIVGVGRNRSRERNDMTRHAELEAIRDASHNLETPYLTECTLVVTLEPCLMCLGAILEARVKRVVFGASSSKNGALGGVMDVTRANWSHQLEVRTGVLEKQSSALLSRFFATTRAMKKA
jgi:tRNA(Ile)-lysidine synthase